MKIMGSKSRRKNGWPPVVFLLNLVKSTVPLKTTYQWRTSLCWLQIDVSYKNRVLKLIPFFIHIIYRYMRNSNFYGSFFVKRNSFICERILFSFVQPSFILLCKYGKFWAPVIELCQLLWSICTEDCLWITSSQQCHFTAVVFILGGLWCRRVMLIFWLLCFCPAQEMHVLMSNTTVKTTHVCFVDCGSERLVRLTFFFIVVMSAPTLLHLVVSQPLCHNSTHKGVLQNREFIHPDTHLQSSINLPFLV